MIARRFGPYRCIGGFLLLVLLFVLHFSTGHAAALTTSVSEVVSSCGGHTPGVSPCQAQTINPASFYEIWAAPNSKGNGQPVTITVTYTCVTGDEGFTLSGYGATLNGTKNYSNVCSGGAGKQHSTASITPSDCSQYDGQYCKVDVQATAVDPPASTGYYGGHVQVTLAVSGPGNPDITYAAQVGGNGYDPSTDGNTNKTDGTWKSSARQFMTFSTGPEFTFTAPCNYSGSAYVGWAGADQNEYYQPNDGLKWILADETANKDIAWGVFGNLGVSGSSAAYSYEFQVTAGHKYEWVWQGASSQNAIVYSLPFTLNPADQNAQCPTAQGTFKNIDVCTSQVTVDGYMSDRVNTGVSFQVVNAGGAVKASGTTNGNNLATYSASTFSYGKTFRLQILEPPDDGGTWITVGTYTTPDSGPAPPCPTGPQANVTCTGAYASDPGSIDYQAPPANTADTGYHWYDKYTSTDTVPSQTAVWVGNSSTGTNYPGDDAAYWHGTAGTGANASANQSYTPGQPTIYYTVNYKEELEEVETGSDGTVTQEKWVIYSQTTNPIHCYSATCSLSVSGGIGPGGVIVTGQTVTVTGTISNPPNGDANQDDLPSALPNGDSLSLTSGSEHAVGSGVPIGGTSPPVSFTVTANGGSDPSTQTVSAYPDYYGTGQLPDPSGNPASCSVQFSVYAPFSLTPNAQVSLSPGQEHPDATDGVQNKTWVTDTGTKVSENVTSSLSEATTACGSSTEASTSKPGPFSPGNVYLFGSAGASDNYAPCSTPLTAGDQYCATVHVPDTTLSGNQAYVGPSGDTVGGGPKDATSCSNVTNRPFFKVYGGGVFAGGDFKSVNAACSDSGTLASWNDDSGTYPSYYYGAGAQIGALALGPISGFASNQYTSNTDRSGPPTYLSFGNTTNTTGAGTDGSSYSPNLGGNLGGTHCLSDVTVPDSAYTPTSDTVNLTDFETHSAEELGSPSAPANVTLNGGSLPSGSASLFVDGNVYITSNITYDDSPAWNLTGSGTPPSFVVHATGNIYIAPSVTELDGLYVAEPASANSGGTIYTCGTTSGSSFVPVGQSSLYGSCNNQLSVYGNFVANQVNLMRTFGSLRDETPTVTASQTVSDNNGAVALYRYSCTDTAARHDYLATDSTDLENQTRLSNPEVDSSTCTQQKSPLGYILPTDNAPTGSATLSLPTGGGSNATYTTSQISFGTKIGNVFTDSSAASDLETVYSCIAEQTPNAGGQPYTYTYYSSSGQSFSPPPGVRCSNGKVAFYLFQTAGDGGTTHQVPASVTPPASLACSNAGSASGSDGTNNGDNLYATCAAEVFYNVPDLYLTSPATEPPSGGATQADSITSLPPVL